MPMATTLVSGLPVTPFHSPLRTLSAGRRKAQRGHVVCWLGGKLGRGLILSDCPYLRT